MAQPGGVLPPRDAPARRPHGRLRGALLLRARADRSNPARDGSRATPGTTATPSCASAWTSSAAASAATTACSSTRTSTSTARRRPLGRRFLRQEHDADHAPAWLVGRPRHAGDDGRDRADSAARAGLRLVHALHRRVSDRRAGRAWRGRCDEVPVVLDAGAGADTGGVPRPSSGRRSTAATSARTCAHGTAASRNAERTWPHAPTREPHVSLADWLEEDGGRAAASATSGSTCRRTTRATCVGTHSSRSVTRAAQANPISGTLR